MYNTTMKPVESLDAFYERHRPQTLENVLWYTYDKKTLPLKLMHAIQHRESSQHVYHEYGIYIHR